MAALVVKILPLSVVDGGNTIDVFGQVTFDNGDYATGGVAAVWDYTTAPDTSLALGKLLRTQAIHATQPPITSVVHCGDAQHSLSVIPVTGSALPKVGGAVVATGAEFTNAAALPAGVQAPLFPHTIWLRYKKNL